MSESSMPSMEQTYTFTLLLQGPDPLTPEHLDALFEHGCDDATFGQRGPVSYAEFDRRAGSFAEAVGSAIRQVEAAVPGLQVVRVEPEELVNAATIAARTGRTRESIRLLAEAKRGPGAFPLPVAWSGGGRRLLRRLWRWSDVASWFRDYLGAPPAGANHAAFLAALNGALEVRRRAAQLATESERELEAERTALAEVISQDAALLGVGPAGRAHRSERPTAAPV